MLSNLLEPSFLTYFLQFHCIGLFGPKSFNPLGLVTKLYPYNSFFRSKLGLNKLTLTKLITLFLLNFFLFEMDSTYIYIISQEIIYIYIYIINKINKKTLSHEIKTAGHDTRPITWRKEVVYLCSTRNLLSVEIKNKIKAPLSIKIYDCYL